MIDDILCPCASGLNYTHCCEPYLSYTKTAETPVKLMRSRYSAYTRKNVQYLIDTWYLPAITDKTELFNSITQSCQSTQWLKLKVLNYSELFNSSSEDYVEFLAFYLDTLTNKQFVIHEKSRFLFINQKWFYVDGIKPHVERNALCPCGSQKKYKKCCYQLYSQTN